MSFRHRHQMGDNHGGLKTRIPLPLRAGTALIAVAIGTSPARRAMFAARCAGRSRYNERRADSGRDIVITVRATSRSAIAGRADRLRRPGRHAEDGLSSVNDILSACRAPAAVSTASSITRSTSATRPTAAVSVPARPRSTLLSRIAPRARPVDGIRYVNGRIGQRRPRLDDINSIPESAIERIEVLQDGASAIYGPTRLPVWSTSSPSTASRAFMRPLRLVATWMERRQHAELPAELGQWRRRPAAGRSRRQLRETGLDRGGRPRDSAFRRLTQHLRRWRMLRLPSHGRYAGTIFGGDTT